MKASVSSASVTRSRSGWDDVEDDGVDYEMRAASPEGPSSPTHNDDSDVIGEDEDLRYEVDESFDDYDQDNSGIRESRADSVDTVSRVRPASREAFGSTSKSDLPPLNKGSKSSVPVSTGNEWDLVLSPHEDSEAFPDDDDIYEDLDEDVEDEGGDNAEEMALNMSRRSNQEEEEEEQMALRQLNKDDEQKGPDDAAKDISMDSSKDEPDAYDDDYEDDYGDDFEDGGEEETPAAATATAPPTKVMKAFDMNSDDEGSLQSIESIEELEEDISVGMASSEDEEEEDRGGSGGRMAHSSSGMLPPATSASRGRSDEEPKASSLGRDASSNMRDFDDNSDDDDIYGTGGPETGSATSEDIDQLDFSVGGGSESESFLLEEDDSAAGRARGRQGDSHEFSASENEISGSHVLNEFDYTTNAAPPRRGGW